jgi:hypothetical protein
MDDIVEGIAEPVVEAIETVAEEKSTHVLIGLAVIAGGLVLFGAAVHFGGKRFDRWNEARRARKVHPITTPAK